MSGQPSITSILKNLRGEEITLQVRGENIKGRILSVEDAARGAIGNRDSFTNSSISLSTASGIKIINMNDVGGVSFSDSALRADLKRALDLILSANEANARNITIDIPGKKRREVTISYVIPTPVWKISYRA